MEMQALHSASSGKGAPAARLDDLPLELLDVVLSLASRDGRSRSALLRYMRVCKALYSPALRVLHRSLTLETPGQARSYLKSLQRSPSPSRLTSSTRRLRIAYSAVAPSDEVPPSLAYPIFCLLDSLHHIEIAADDGLALFGSAVRARGGELGQLETFTSTRAHWDKLVGLIARSNKLRSIEVDGLYAEEPPALTAGDQEQIEGDVGDAFKAGEPSPLAPAIATPAPLPAIRDLLSDALGDKAAPVWARPDPPTLPLLHPPPFPLLPLRSMTLFKPQLGDAHLLAMVSSSRNTLEALVLRESDCFSRFALVGSLRLLHNLLELELSACTFARPDDDTAAAAPVPAPALGLPLSPARRPPAAVPPHSALSLPPEWDLLAPGTPSHAALTRRVSSAELAHPLDYLARLCPFLHVLVLASAPQPAGATRRFATRLAVDEREALFSQEAVPRLMAELPLQSLELDLSAPVIEASDVLDGLKRAGGRLESLFIGKELRWEREDLDKVISASSTSRTTVSGEVADFV